MTDKTKDDDMTVHVNSLITKAAAQKDGCDAMRFSQAALNCANAIGVGYGRPKRADHAVE